MATRVLVMVVLIAALVGAADAQVVVANGPGRLEAADMDGVPVWVGHNPGLGATVVFGDDGAVRLRSSVEGEGSWRAGLWMVGWGPDGYGRDFPVERVTAEGNRLLLERDGADESFANEGSRVAQQVRVAEPPAGWDGTAPLELSLELLEGCTARPFGTRVVQLLDGELGQAVLDLRLDRVRDAAGRSLDASLVAAEGRVILRLEAAEAQFPLRLKLLLEPPSWVVWGAQNEARAGYAVATAGDVNGDGYSDVVVGLPEWNGGQTDEGRVQVYHGSAAGLGASPAWSWEPNEAGAQAGFSVSTAGDVNGDGYSDLIVGAPYANGTQSDQGKAWVFLGSASGLASSAQATLTFAWSGGHFGWSVSTAGDVNSDGYSDVIVGAPDAYLGLGNDPAGGAFVYHGSASGVSATASWSQSGYGTRQDNLGYRVALAGDVNGDGYSDILVGSPNTSQHGCGWSGNLECDWGLVKGWLGSAGGVGSSFLDTSDSWVPAWYGPYQYCKVGQSLTTVGDLNGDGYSDIAFGTPGGGEYCDNGFARVWLGTAAGVSSLVDLDGTPGSGYGASLCTAGDVNGDGWADLMVGTHDRLDLDDVGQVEVVFGAADGMGAGRLLLDVSFESTGWAVALAGDVNGDGYSDLIGGAPYANTAGGVEEGVAFVWYGKDTDRSGEVEANEEMESFDGVYAGEGFGSAVTWVDADNDGYDDMLVGVPNFSSGRGRVRIYCGRADALPDPTACWMAAGASTGDEHGTAVAAGDLNGDGYNDIVVGGPAAGAGGKAWVYCGQSGGLLPVWSPCAVLSGSGGEGFGTSLAVVGDVNGDGYADLLVGAPYHLSGTSAVGAAYLWLGGADLVGGEPDLTLLGTQANARFGYSVAGAGDVNRDGTSDLVVGARSHDQGGLTNCGAVYVYHGRVALYPLPTPARTLYGDNEFGMFGHSVASAGDVNGDGYADLVVGAPYRSTASLVYTGRASVYHGSASGVSATAAWYVNGNQAEAHYGYSVSSAGDVNGDGYADVLVGAPGFDTTLGSTTYVDGGRVVLAFGGNGGLGSDLVNPDSYETGGELGRAVGPGGDVNGDGFAEVPLCTPGRDSGTGRVVLWSRKYGPTVRPRQLDAAGSTAIPFLGAADAADRFTVALGTDTIFGRAYVRLQAEVKPRGTAFNGAGLQQQTNWTNSSGVATLFQDLTGLSASTLYHWRERLRYNPTSTPLQPHGPWRSRPVGGWNEADLRTATSLPADLQLTAGDSFDPIPVGGTVEDLVVLVNTGPFPATSVVLDLSGSVTTLPGLAVTPSYGSCVMAPAVQCTFGTLSSGTQVTVLVQATANTPGTKVLDATVTASSQDPDLGNNHWVETTTVVMPAGQEFLVTSAGDGADANPGNGVCATSSGECTLRAAVGEANAFANADTVTIATPDTITVGSGVLITANLTVRSGLNRRALISGNHSSRVFSVAGASYPDVSFERLELVDGHADEGSLVLLENADDVTFTDCRIAGGYAVDGGAVAVGAYAGHLLFDRCVLEDNVSEVGGGAIYVNGATTDQRDTLEVRASVFSGNHAGAAGGGGAAIAVYNTFWDLLITDSLFSHNVTAEGDGGALDIYSLAGNVAVARIERSSFVGNRVTCASCRGGAISATTTHLHLVNCTFSGNSAPLSGGALYQAMGELALSATTIANNTAPSGGGISGSSSPVVLAAGTILSGNGSNCSGVGTITGDLNLSSDASCTFAGSGNLNSTNPLLGPFGGLGSGGPLYRLQTGSPALDSGDSSLCRDAYGDALDTDQRASGRPEDGDGNGVSRCDRGTYEAHPGDAFSDSFETGNTSRWSSVVP